MNAADQARAAWLESEFWDRLERLEARHQHVHCEHERARRELERLSNREADEVRRSWHHYCEAIAQLDQTSAEIESLRS
jgi:hypothetical protein